MSATIIARRISATPQRLSSDVWTLITGLLAPQDDKITKADFAAVAGIGSFLIENEALKDAPLVVWGAGPRVRVYCLYGDDAITSEDANESPLSESPTLGNWQISLPAHADDIDWIRKSLTAKGVARITVRELSDPVPDDQEGNPKAQSRDQSWQINEEVFRRL
jgi:hypothetical protein